MNNLRYAVRQLRKSPGFTFVAVLTLALGIGANTAIFTVVNAVLLSPLPYPDADRLVMVQSRNLQENLKGLGFAPAGFRDVEKQVTSFDGFAAGRYNYDNLTGIEKPTSLTGTVVTQDYFKVLGEKPLLGRTFTKEDAAANAKATVVLTYDLWQKQFGGRREIIGESVTLNDVPHEVIGVMPRTFKDPFNIPSLWRILPNEGGENAVANARFWAVIARLKPGVSISTAQAELATIAARLRPERPEILQGMGIHGQSVARSGGGELSGRFTARGRRRVARPFDHVRERRRPPICSRLDPATRSRDPSCARRQPFRDRAQSIDRIAPARDPRRNWRRAHRQLGIGFAPGEFLRRLDSTQ